MNKGIWKKFMIIATFCVVLMSFCSCGAATRRNYYAQKGNYISVTGTVSHLKYSNDGTQLYLGFSELSPQLDDVNFKIVGENLKLARENQIDSKLKIGDRVEFVTAPRYFGDGYTMPIVALSVDGEKLLDFKEGYDNWMEFLS